MGSGEGLRFTVLGPVRAWRGGEPLDLGAARQRAVLAMLLLHANRPVGRESLIEAVWGDPAPAYAVNQLQKYISALRRVLEPGRPLRSPDGLLTWSDGGYTLLVEPNGLDLAVFERRVGLGREAMSHGEAEQAAAELKTALGLWSGTALASVSSAFLEAERDRLMELRTAVLEERIKADLHLGRHGKLVPELTRLVAEFPLRESFAALLMLALYRSGRQSDALTTFHEVRRNLREELGMDPGREVQEIHEKILSSASSLAWRGPSHQQPHDVSYEASELLGEGGGRIQGLHQLPVDIPEFVGREEELRELWDLVGQRGTASDCGDRRVLASVIEGMAGVGKTRLAVHAAHQFIAQGRFTDVQLWADLMGFSPDCEPTDPAKVLADFLRLLGIPGGRIPESVEARAALYRDRLVGKRALVVLDNAADEEQVRHLLPGSASCLLLITSRRVFSGLDGAHTIQLGAFSPREAVKLIDRVACREWKQSESAAALRVAKLTGRLPIAVALAGRRLRARPTWSMGDLADRLERGEERLGQLTGGKRAVHATFELSYKALSEAQQRAFRMMALHPGEDCTADSAAAVLGIGRGEADSLLESLLDEHLLQQHVAGRYRYHDLLRLYAADRACTEETTEQRTEANHRLVQWYCSIAEEARHYLDLGWRPPSSGGERGSEQHTTSFFDDSDSAVQWLEQERANLLSASREAARNEWNDCAWRLTAAHAYLGKRSYGMDSLEGLQLGLAAARRTGDRDKEAWSLCDLGQVLDSVGQHEDAEQQHRSALAIFEEDGNRQGAAEALYGLGRSSFCLGRYAVNVEQHRQALALFEELGDVRRQASTHQGLGLANWFLRREQDLDVDHHRRAVALYEELGDQHGQAYQLISLGLSHWFFGNYAECARQHRRALALFEELGDRHGQAMSLHGLGLADWHLGHPAQARDYHHQGLAVSRELRDRRGEAIALQRVGYVNWATGHYNAGEKQLHETLAICAETGNRSTRAWALTSLGHLCLRQQRNDEGEEHLLAALDLARTLGDQHPEASALIGLALVKLNRGQLPACEGGARQALALSQSIGNVHSQAWSMITLGLACCFGQRPEEGAQWHEQAADIGHITSDPFTEAIAVNGVGFAYTQLGRYEEAERHLRAALAVRRLIEDRHGEAETLTDLAALLHVTGRFDAGVASRELSLSKFVRLGVPATELWRP